MKLRPMPLPLRVNKSLMTAFSDDLGDTTSLRRNAAESVKEAPNPSIG